MALFRYLKSIARQRRLEGFEELVNNTSFLLTDPNDFITLLHFDNTNILYFGTFSYVPYEKYDNQLLSLSNIAEQYFLLDDWSIDTNFSKEKWLTHLFDLINKIVPDNVNVWYKRLYVISIYYSFLYFFITNNRCMNIEGSITTLLHVVKGVLDDIEFDEEYVKEHLHSEAFDIALETVNKLEKSLVYQKPFSIKDLFNPIKYSINFSLNKCFK